MPKRIDLFGHDKGIGDTISRVIKTVSRGKIKECGGCQKRKEYLNKKIPFRNLETKKYE
ncbi:uncharacterized protein METZ01_LOCUS212095 [marine metagenome]|jgi:hypothetical protein|uniref:Uncharacterized protein n=1 Tax=marine metagenome TaxID=408172 RepID=A0A382FB11_9ZZZZ